jgi:hypothetical protein
MATGKCLAVRAARQRPIDAKEDLAIDRSGNGYATKLDLSRGD